MYYIKYLFIILLSINGFYYLLSYLPLYFKTETKKDFLSLYITSYAIYNNVDYTLPLDELSRQIESIHKKIYFPHPTPHPPTMGLILMPLALFDYSQAENIWFFMQLAFVTYSIMLIFRILKYDYKFYHVLILLLILQAWPPLIQEFFQGQVNSLLLIIIVFIWKFIMRNQSFLSGFALGISLLVKQIIWPLLFVFLLFGDYIATASCISTVLIAYLIIGFYSGFPLLLKYFLDVLPLNAELYIGSPFNCSIWTITRFFKETFHQPDIKMNSVTIKPFFEISNNIVSAYEYVIIFFLFLFFLIIIKQYHNQIFCFILLICSCLIFNPYVWLHYHTLLLIPFFYIFDFFQRFKYTKMEILMSVCLIFNFFFGYAIYNQCHYQLRIRLSLGNVVINSGELLPILARTINIIFLIVFMLLLKAKHNNTNENLS